MSKLYHVTVRANNGTHQEDIIAASMDVAVKRALAKSYRTSKSLHIEANLSNHGEYDKATWTCFKADGGRAYVYKAGLMPRYIRRATAQASLDIEALRVLKHCPDVHRVTGKSKNVEVTVTKDDEAR